MDSRICRSCCLFSSALLAWIFTFATADIRVARAGWALDGIPVASGTGDQLYPMVLADGAGGAFVLWQDHRGADFDIYMQRISADGTPQWTTNGLAVSTASGDQLVREHGTWTYAPGLISDGNGGVIVTW